MSRNDLWLLMRLAAQNVGRRRLRAIFLGAAVMLGGGIGFASFVAGWALWQGMTQSFSRMGADLLVVPRATLVNITASLLTVQPTDETLAAELAQRIAAVPGVARVAPQRVVPTMVEGISATLIAFDPTRDFSVLSWLEAQQASPVEGLIAGGALSARLGETVSVCGMAIRISGHLGKTGVGPFDESYFLSFDALAEVVSFCRRSDAPAKPAVSAKVDDAPAVRGMGHADACSGNPEARPGFRLPVAIVARGQGGGRQVRARPASGREDRRRQRSAHVLAPSAEHIAHRHGRLHRIGAHRLVDPSCPVVLRNRARTLSRGWPAARNGGKVQSDRDDHPCGSCPDHRPGRARRSRLRGRGVADVCPLAWLLFRAARRPVLLAAGRRAPSRSAPGHHVLGPAWSPRRFRPRLAGAAHGAVCAHSVGGAMTLSAQSLTKRYGAAPGYVAVHGASLELQLGEFISIVGRSGSGKSTLMAMLGALTPPTEGRLLFDGTDLWTLSETERAAFRARQIGFVFQFPSLLSNLTAA